MSRLHAASSSRFAVLVPPSSQARQPPGYTLKREQGSPARASSSSTDPLTSPAQTGFVDPQPPPPPAKRYVYVPRTNPPPQLFNHASAASPSYDRVRVVDRVREKRSGRQWYRLVRLQAATKLSLLAGMSHVPFTQLDAEAAAVDAQIVAEQSNNSPAQSRSPSRSIVSRVQSNTYVVAAEDILNHISAAELEAYENAAFRREEEHERAIRAAREAKLKSRYERKAILARQLNVDINELVLSSESSTSNSDSDSSSTRTGSTRKSRDSKREAIRALKSPIAKRRKVIGGAAKAKAVAEAKGKGKVKAKGLEDEYVVQALVNHRDDVFTGSREFEVEWRGFPGENTWEPESGLQPAMVKRYFKGIKDAANGKALATANAAPSAARDGPGKPAGKDIVMRDAADEEDEEVEYVIESILKDAVDEDTGRRMFLVAWEGFPGQDTWEFEEQLPAEMLVEYLTEAEGLFHA